MDTIKTPVNARDASFRCLNVINLLDEWPPFTATHANGDAA